MSDSVLELRMFVTSRPRSAIRIQRLAKMLRKKIMAECGPLNSADMAVLDFAMDHWLRAVRCASEAARLEAQGMAKKNGERIAELRRESEKAKDGFVKMVRELQRGQLVGAAADEVGGAA